MEIVIDNYKCPSWNTFYAGVHWTKRKKKADEIHSLVFGIVHNIKKKVYKLPVKIEIDIHYKDRRRRDPDNACIKPFIDGLVQSGILKDDSSKEIEEISIRLRTEQKEDKITINIYEQKKM